MTKAEQHKLIEELKDYIPLMKGNDYYDYEMYVRRDQDDEDLDSLSVKRLMELYTVYAKSRPKPRMKNPFEKS